MPTKAQIQDQDQAKDELRPILESHPDVYAIVHHVSRSGMSRRIDFYVIEERSPDSRYPEGKTYMRRISHLVARVHGSRLTDDGVVVGGCGMDMGWHEIYSCRYALGLGEIRHNGSGNAPQFSLGYGFDVRYL